MVAQRLAAVAALLVLSAIGAELLAAYDDTTGRPVALLGSVVFFALLYGCPALLIREYAWRSGRGWPAMLLLAMAAGLLQAGVLDQSLFSERYDSVRGWEASFQRTAVAPLGLSGSMLQGFVLGHVIYSFCAPIALVEGMFPAQARRPWLRRGGLIAAAVSWLLVAAAIFADAGEATANELVSTLAVVAVLVVAALRVRSPRRPAHGPRIETLLAGSFALATAHALMPDTWLGTAGALLIALAAGAWLLAGGGLDPRPCAALAAGALVSRGTLAFTYFPLVGETPAIAKYAHNVVMIAIVLAATARALRPGTLRDLLGNAQAIHNRVPDHGDMDRG